MLREYPFHYPTKFWPWQNTLFCGTSELNITSSKGANIDSKTYMLN